MATPEPPALRRVIGTVLVVYLLFMVYGSLVPLQAVSMPLDEAWRRLTTPLPAADAAAAWSRVDVAVNTALALPAALLAWAWSDRPGLSPAARHGRGVAVWMGCVLLALGLEFAQVFFPSRSPALSDVGAQALGAALGLLLYAHQGPALRRWAAGWWRDQEGAALVVWLLRAWWVGLLLAAMLPLDLSLSPVELWRKWRDGRVVLMPLADLPREGIAAAQQVGIDLLLWLPVGVLWRLQGQPFWRVVAGGALAAAAIELAQLMVLSRVSGSTDVAVGALGVAIGAWVAGRWAGSAGRGGLAGGSAGGSAGGWADSASAAAATMSPAARRRRRHAWGWAWLAWALAVPLLYTMPFGFDWADPSLPARAQAAWTRLPFEALAQSGEQRAVTEILRKLLVFLPGGLAWALWQASRGRAALWAWLALSAALALAVEAAQLALPGKFSDPTDALLGWLGGIAGWLIGQRAQQRGPEAPAAPRALPAARPAQRRGQALPSEAAVAAPAAPYRHGTASAGRAMPPALGWADGAVVCLLALALWGVARAPGVPYNLRELLPASAAGGAAALAVAAALWWCWAMPLALAQHWARRPGAAAYVLLLAPVLPLPAGLALLAAAPRESLHDVLGSPVWSGVPPALELLLRHAGLQGALMLATVAGVWAIARLAWARPMGVLPMGLVSALAWAVPAHALVVAWAATDNLTELMRGGGSLGVSLCLGAGLWLLTMGFSAAAALLAGMPLRPALWLAVPLGWVLGSLLLWWGTEPVLVKYGRVFSAAQFLLSAGRDQYAAAPELLARWALLLLGATAAVALLQAPRWRALRQAHGHTPGLRRPA